jgi:hypothetical protein
MIYHRPLAITETVPEPRNSGSMDTAIRLHRQRNAALTAIMSQTVTDFRR